MVAANIPWTKLNNPILKGFLTKYTNRQIPDESTLRKNYLHPQYFSTIEKMKEDIGDSYFWASVDETTDRCGRYIANIVVGKLDSTGPSSPHLIASRVLEVTNSSTIARVVRDSLRHSRDQEPTIPGHSRDQEPTIPGHSRDQEPTIPGSLCQQEPIVLGPLRQQELSVPGHSRDQEPTIPGHSREQELTVLGPLCQQEPTVLGPSREQESTIPGHSREQELTVPGSSIKQERPSFQQELTVLGSSCQQELTIPGPSKDQESTFPGPSKEQDLALQGYSEELEPTIPGPSREKKFAIPGISFQPELTILGPSCQQELTVPGFFKRARVYLPGPSREQELTIQGSSEEIKAYHPRAFKKARAYHPRAFKKARAYHPRAFMSARAYHPRAFMSSFPSKGRQENKSLPSQDLQKIKSFPSKGRQESKSLPSQDLQEIKSFPSKGRQESKSLPSRARYTFSGNPKGYSRLVPDPHPPTLPHQQTNHRAGFSSIFSRQGHSAHSTTCSCPSIVFKMGRGKTITVEQCAGQFKADQFYVSDSKILMCGICNIRLASDKKDSLNKHVVSAGHLRGKEEQKTHGLKRQLSITEVCDKQKKAKTEKLVFIDDTVKMCLKANIPINKLDHPAVREYLKKHIPGFGDLPCGRNLRQNFVQPIGEEMKLELKEKVQGVPIVIVVDETSDSLKMAFLNARKMKSAYVRFLQEEHADLPAILFPSPVVTRWNSWFHSVLYLNDYSDALIEFLGQYENNNASAEYLLEQQRDPVAWQSLKLQMVFIADSCKMFVELINKLEGSKFPFAHLLWHELEALSVLKRLSYGNFLERNQSLLGSITSVAKREELKQLLCGCAQKSAMKLAKHMAPCTTNNFFKAAGELFNPAIAAQSLTPDEKSVRKQFEVLPLFSKLTSDKCFCLVSRVPVSISVNCFLYLLVC
uniref:Uncharacterized protein n=1 Tax=Timema bartmani TaxID=61472 RepID=A0A7R9ERI0_9NEOP|nr:unnamed protein product [Timema bartmani]